MFKVYTDTQNIAINSIIIPCVHGALCLSLSACCFLLLSQAKKNISYTAVKRKRNHRILFNTNHHFVISEIRLLDNFPGILIVLYETFRLRAECIGRPKMNACYWKIIENWKLISEEFVIFSLKWTIQAKGFTINIVFDQFCLQKILHILTDIKFSFSPANWFQS